MTGGDGTRGPRRGRLSRSAEFERVYRRGRSKADRYFVVYRFPQEAEPTEPAAASRLGLSVSRRVGGAVDRTRVKRLIREAFWTQHELLSADSDYVVVARPDARGLAEREGMEGVRRHLAGLLAALDGGTPASS